ncbi:MAG: TdeIII family type II restriction endonuclease [Ignavibacteria bacterium]|jgi:type II restriction enzyme
MSFNTKQIKEIEEVIKRCLRNKFKNYKAKSNYMPFHTKLLGKDRMALYSFIQSLNTQFGTSIFEPVAVALAHINFKTAKSQYAVGDHISQEAQNVIQDIINSLSVNGDPNKVKEIELIRKVCNKGTLNSLKTVKVDLYIENNKNEIFLFDLKTTKPNKSNFKDFKRTLLEWIAITFLSYPKAKVYSFLAIPYNPYYPNPYENWTMKGMIDIKNELKVGEEFWDFLGGNGAYEELLDCFERVGIEMRDEIDEYFKKFKK